MGRFYIYNGNLGHWIPIYHRTSYKTLTPVHDNEDADYEVEDNDEVFLSTRICRECCQTFTLDELLSRFNEVIKINII